MTTSLAVRRVASRVHPAIIALLAFGLLLSGCDQDATSPDGSLGSHLPFDPAAAVGSAALNSPSNASAVASSETQIDLSWQDNSSNESKFEIHRSTTETGTFTLQATTSAQVTAYSNSAIDPGTQYCYRVRAARAKANTVIYSGFSNTACATTPLPPAPPPQSPTSPLVGINAKPVSSSIVTVSWTDTSTSGHAFRVERSTDGGALWTQAGTAWAGEVLFYDFDRVSEQQVCYRVIAFNAGGDAPASDVDCTSPPAGPTSLSVAAVDTQTIALSWSDNSAIEDTYQVWLRWYRGTYYCYPPGYEGAVDAGTYEGEGLVAELPANSMTYNATPVNDDSCGTTYSFYVVATRDGGNSDASNDVSAASILAP